MTMRFRYAFFFLVVIFGLSGCFPQRPPSPYREEAPSVPFDLETADCGTTPADYEAAIRAYMQPLLKDPESARYRVLNSPKKIFNGIRCIYQIDVFVNAKNSYGGYVGERLMIFYFRDGIIIGRQEENRGRIPIPH